MRTVLADFGGSRTKLAVFERGQTEIEELTVLESPDKFEDFLGLVAEFYFDKKATAWATALQGNVPLPDDSPWLWEYGPTPRSKDKKISYQELVGLTIKNNLPPPQLAINDITAATFGIVKSDSALVIQISTGIGVRVVQDNRILLAENDKPLLSAIRLNDCQYQGNIRSFYDWLRWQKMQDWLPKDLQGLSWRELGKSNNPAVDDIVEVIVQLIKQTIAATTFKQDPPIYLTGGGAFALRELLTNKLLAKDIVVQFPEASETPGLCGLAELLNRDFNSDKIFKTVIQ